jgi:hypothetical protein
MSGTGGACASASNGTGTTPSLGNSAAAGTNATGFGSNFAAGPYGMGVGTGATTAGALSGTNGSTAAAYYGTGGYGVTPWSDPYAQAANAYGISPGGSGTMGGTSGDSSSPGIQPNLLSDPYAAAMASDGWGSIDTMPRLRSKTTKSRAKLKAQARRAKATSR